MGGVERREAWQEPAIGVEGRGGDVQFPQHRLAGNLEHRRLHLVEAPGQGIAQPLCLCRQGHFAGAPDEERQADGRFQRLDLVTDRGLSHAEFRRAALEAPVPGSGLEGAQLVERGQAAVHEVMD